MEQETRLVAAAKGRESAPRPRLAIVAVGLALMIVVLAIEVPPSTLLGKADAVGYAICHRIPERSFFLNGRQLPLCARCTGTFLGAMLGMGALILYRRQRAARLPSVPVLGLMILFIALWGFDGLNSYLTFFPGAPHLYEPRNWLRMTTGMLNGLALITLVWPIFNFTLWREPKEQAVLDSAWQLLAILPVAGLLVFLVNLGIGALLYPLAILSSAGVVLMLTMINTMIAAVILGREGYARSWPQALVPLIVGAGLALLQMAAMILLRAYLTTTLGLTF
ncbi:MAG TPA: DUF2085 domain-containing protein [Anaerolineae bacterium]|nr:DUF2085 domain-containing protein [Anaerolineae bacterium]